MDRTRELISFTKNLYYFTKMGASITDSLPSIKGDLSDKQFRYALGRLKDNIESGKSLSEAMEKESDIFPLDYVKLIEAAEETDTLPEVLNDLASHMEILEITKRNVRYASFYPAVIINFSCIFLFIIHYFVSDILFNHYVKFILDTGQELSPHVWLFLNSAKFIFSPLFIGILLVLIICFDIIIFTRSSFGSSVFFKLPLIKDIFRKSYMCRISRATGFMLKHGITMDKALEAVTKTIDTNHVKKELLIAIDKLKSGKALSDSLENINLFNSTFLFMIKEGEKNGRLPESLFEAAEYFEDEMNDLYSKMLKFVEPAFIITVGIIIGFFLLSIMVPFYSITTSITGFN